MAEVPRGDVGKRKQLKQLFEHANKVMGQDNCDYATELLTQCILGDPGNLMYVQTFLGNLKRKYHNNKRGGSLAFVKTVFRRSRVKKALLQKRWDSVIKSGLEIIKVNPWNVWTLLAMAEAARGLDLEEVELAYLKGALEPDPKNVGVNRRCARALAERKQFDQSDACWRRVLQARPKDEEAKKAIGDLAVEKTIARGGYDGEDVSQKAIPSRGEQASDRRPDESDQQRLMRLIRKNPADLAPYLDLAGLYVKDEQFDMAEKVLFEADRVSPGNADVRHRVEDLQLTRLRHRAAELKKKLEKNPTPDREKEHKKMLEQIEQQELQFYRNRCQRFPTNLAYRYELGLRYQHSGQYKEAISELQRAKLDSRRRGVCDLALGQCFQQVNQLPLALNHYSSAAEELPEHDLDQKKMALYLAGTTAMALQKREAATRYLTSLAGLDYAYRDVSALLDKLAQLGDDEE
jgi:tetratricopeptide (TPR) repeat protein